jgi:heme exporter protein C
MTSATSARTQQRSTGAGLTGWDVALLALDVLVVLAMVAAVWAALLYARPAANLAGTEQAAQRIFYFHIGSVMGALAGFMVALIGAILYLVRRNLEWDRMAHAGVELGVVFGMGVLVTGSIWAKPTWLTYWTWDPRLTTAAITVLLYVAYLLFRNGIDNRNTRALFSSIYALFAFLSVPLTYYSARWFRTIHPVVFNGSNPDEQGGFAVGPTMSQTLMIASIAFLLLFSALLIHRWRQLRLEDRLEELREELY